MSRERMTIKADGVEAAVAALEKSISAETDEKDIVQEADAAAKEEKKVVNKSVPAGPAELKDQGDQNAKANGNWKLTEAQRNNVAQRLVVLAKALLEG